MQFAHFIYQKVENPIGAFRVIFMSSNFFNEPLVEPTLSLIMQRKDRSRVFWSVPSNF